MQQQKKMKNRQTDNCEKTLTKYPQKILLLILPEIFTEIFTFSKGFFFFLNSLSFKTFTTQPTLIWFYSCKFRIKHSLQHSHFKGFFRCCQLHSKHLAQHSHPKSFFQLWLSIPSKNFSTTSTLKFSNFTQNTHHNTHTLICKLQFHSKQLHHNIHILTAYLSIKITNCFSSFLFHCSTEEGVFTLKYILN